MATKKNLEGRMKADASKLPTLTTAQYDAALSNLAEGIRTAFRKASDHPTAHQAWTAIRNMPPEQWGNVVEFVAYVLFGPRPAKGGR